MLSEPCELLRSDMVEECAGKEQFRTGGPIMQDKSMVFKRAFIPNVCEERLKTRFDCCYSLHARPSLMMPREIDRPHNHEEQEAVTPCTNDDASPGFAHDEHSFRLSAQVGPRGILARTFRLASFSTAGAWGEFHVVRHRSLDAATHGHIDARDMVNIGSARHYFPFGSKPNSLAN